jgi:hypothetical protein
VIPIAITIAAAFQTRTRNWSSSAVKRLIPPTTLAVRTPLTAVHPEVSCISAASSITHNPETSPPTTRYTVGLRKNPAAGPDMGTDRPIATATPMTANHGSVAAISDAVTVT